MFRELLSKDAFVRPAEVKSKPIADFKKLYGDEIIRRDYGSDVKGEAKRPGNSSRDKFKAQFQQLLDALEAWGDESECESDYLEEIGKFKDTFFNAEYSGNQAAIYFNTIKQNLENIWFVLCVADDIDIKRKHDILISLCKAFTACAPGLYSRIEDIANSLVTDISLERWLAELRTNLIRLYAERHVKEFKISNGYSIHVHNALLLYAADAGWGPLSDVDKTIDPFAAGNNTDIDADAITTSFIPFFEEGYTPKAIVDCVCTNFVFELKRYQESLGIKEDKNGWVASAPEYLKKVTELAGALNIGVEQVNFFDLNDDATLMRFNPDVFRAIFAKACLQNKKLFNTAFWAELDLPEGGKFFVLADQIAWFENSDKEITTWSKLTEKCDPIALVGKYLTAINEVHWKQLMEHTGNKFNTVIKTAVQLSRLLKHIPLKEHIKLILENYYDSDVLTNMFSSGLDVHLFLSAFSPEERWKAEQVFERCSWFFLINAIKTREPEAVKILLRAEEKVVPLSESNLDCLVEAAVKSENAPVLKMFLDEYKVGINKKNSNDENLLHIAVKQNKTNILEVLVEHRADFYVTNKEGFTPLHVAVSECNLEAVKFLVKNNAFFSTTWGHPKTPLKIALEKNYRAIALEILKLPEVAGYESSPIAMLAARHGSIDALLTLENHDIDLLAPTQVQKTTVAHIATAYNHVEILEMFFNRDAHIDTTDWIGDTLVHQAARYNLVNILQCLSDHSINLNRVNNQKETPAHVAARANSLQSILFLIEAKVDFFNKKDNQDSTPLTIAVAKNQWQMASIIMGADPKLSLVPGRNLAHKAIQSGFSGMIGMLAEEKVDLNQRDKDGVTPAHIAAQRDDDAAINELAKFKVNFNQGNSRSETPLHFAVMCNAKKALTRLLNMSVDVNCRDHVGMTPAHIAMKLEDVASVKLLMDARADFTLKTAKGETPVSYWTQQQEEIKVLLVGYAAEFNNIALLKIIHEHKLDLALGETRNAQSLHPARIAVTKDNLEFLKELAKCAANTKEFWSSTIGFAIDENHWNMVTSILLFVKDFSYFQSQVSVLQSKRDVLTNTFIYLAKRMSDEERNRVVSQVLKNENALGAVLNTPNSWVLHYFQSGNRHGMTEKMFRITQELNYESVEEKKVEEVIDSRQVAVAMKP